MEKIYPPPPDTLQAASQEAEAWRVAQLGDTLEEVEDETNVETRQTAPVQVDTGLRYKCQVDGSWSEKDKWMGLGFTLVEAGVVILQGQKCTHRAQSPLKTEAETLIWALSEMKNRGCDGVTVESDCQQLINIFLNETE